MIRFWFNCDGKLLVGLKLVSDRIIFTFLKVFFGNWWDYIVGSRKSGSREIVEEVIVLDKERDVDGLEKRDDSWFGEKWLNRDIFWSWKIFKLICCRI